MVAVPVAILGVHVKPDTTVVLVGHSLDVTVDGRNKAWVPVGMGLSGGGLAMALLASRLSIQGDQVLGALLVSEFALSFIGSWIIIELAQKWPAREIA